VGTAIFLYSGGVELATAASLVLGRVSVEAFSAAAALSTGTAGRGVTGVPFDSDFASGTDCP